MDDFRPLRWFGAIDHRTFELWLGISFVDRRAGFVQSLPWGFSVRRGRGRLRLLRDCRRTIVRATINVGVSSLCLLHLRVETLESRTLPLCVLGALRPGIGFRQIEVDSRTGGC